MRGSEGRPGRENLEANEGAIWTETSQPWLVHRNELSIDKGPRIHSFHS